MFVGKLKILNKVHSVTTKERVVFKMFIRNVFQGRNKNSVKIVTNRMILKFLCTSKNKGTILLVDVLV